MTAADFLIKLERDLASGFLHLLVLAHVERIGPIHGYGLIKAMDDATGNKGLWKEGTVYPLLNQLEKEGLVRSRWGKGASGPRRKYYEMGAPGRQALKVATAQWHEWRNTLDNIVGAT